MRIMVIGCGKVGCKFANTLYKEGHEVIILDSNPRLFSQLEPDFNGITITGVPTDPDVLANAGIESVDAVTAVTPDDNVNIMVCQLAKEIFKVPKVIARIYNPEREHIFHHFGLETICPTNITADMIRGLLFNEKDPKSVFFGNSAVVFRYATYQDDQPISINSIMPGNHEIIFGYIDNGQFHFATEDVVLEKGFTIVFALLEE